MQSHRAGEKDALRSYREYKARYYPQSEVQEKSGSDRAYEQGVELGKRVAKELKVRKRSNGRKRG